MISTEQILSEFIDAWNAGRRPRVLEYLQRVPSGQERDELAEQITTWLAVAPGPAYDEHTRAAIRKEPVVERVLAASDAEGGLWPSMLPALRERAGLSVTALAGQLADGLDLPRGSRAKTADYLARMERGRLKPERVSRRLLDQLGAILGTSGEVLAAAGMVAGDRLRAAPAGGTLFRAAAPADHSLIDEIEALSQAALTPAPEPMDEVDRLFTGGPDA